MDKKTTLINDKKGFVWQPFFWSVLLIIIVVLFINFVIAGFVDIDSLPKNSFLNSSADFINTGFQQTLIDFPDWIPFLPDNVSINLNPFDLLGDSNKDFIVDQVETFAIVPTWLIFTLGFALVIGLGALFVSIIRGTG